MRNSDLNFDKLLTDLRPVVAQLVPGLMRLYVDAQELEAVGQYQEKIDVRHNVVMFLVSLWKIPAHREVWRGVLPHSLCWTGLTC